jgi:hypothetical protein
MAIDRTWWNNLVDDDGSGNVGTVWNKNTIKGLLDAIDGMQGYGLWTPTLNGSGGGTPTYASRAGVYQRNNNSIILGGRLTLSSKGSLAGAVSIGGFPAASAAAAAQGGFVVGYVANLAVNVASLGGYIPNGSTFAQLVSVAAAGGSSTGALDASQIGVNFDLIFGAVYAM